MTGGFLYITESNSIRRIEISTTAVTTFAGATSAGFVDATTDTNARFSNPRSITTDGTNLYLSDHYSNRVRKIEIATKLVTTIAGDGSTGSADGDDTQSELNHPHGITTDGTNLYFTDQQAYMIRKLVLSTNVASRETE